MKLFRSVALGLSFLLAVAPASAQWQTPNHSVPIGLGAGVTGFGSAAPGASGGVLTSNGPAADPSFQALPPPNPIVCGFGLVCGAGGKVTLYGQFWLGDFGAACNNSTDDSTAFNNAIAAAGAIGGAVKIPLTTCLIASNISVPTSVGIIKIEGLNKFQSQLNFTNNAGFSFTTNIGMIELRDFTVGCTTAASCITLGSATTGPTESTVERLHFIGGGNELELANTGAIRVHDNDFFNCTNQCIHITAPANVDGGDSWIDHNFMLNSGVFAGTGIGILQGSGGGWKITNNKINQFSVDYFLSAQLASHASSAYQIQDNSLEGCGTACILLQNAGGNGSLLNVVISGNEMGGGSGSFGIELNADPGGWVASLNISGNVIDGVNANGGIFLDGADKFNISGNTITDNGTCGTGITITGNSSRGMVVGNTIVSCTTQVTNVGSVVTAVNNGP